MFFRTCDSIYCVIAITQYIEAPRCFVSFCFSKTYDVFSIYLKSINAHKIQSRLDPSIGESPINRSEL